MTIWRTPIACWISRATNTHSGFWMLIAFPRQQWLNERAPVLRYTYIACLGNTVYIYIYIYTYIHTHIYIHTHTHTYIYNQLVVRKYSVSVSLFEVCVQYVLIVLCCCKMEWFLPRCQTWPSIWRCLWTLRNVSRLLEKDVCSFYIGSVYLWFISVSFINFNRAIHIKR